MKHCHNFVAALIILVTVAAIQLRDAAAYIYPRPVRNQLPAEETHHAHGVVSKPATILETPVSSLPFPYATKWFDQRLSHFDSTEALSTTFKQRYLINDTFFDTKTGHIFLYAGNEGPIEEFWNNTGFIFDIAEQFRALVLFPEHRFYGQSLPNGDHSFEGPYLNLLNIQQAIADYAYLLNAVRAQYNADTVPVVAFGGSYGGQLAAYMRIRYPQFVDMAVASSSPMYLLASMGRNDSFFATVTDVAESTYAGCSDAIRNDFATIKAHKDANDMQPVKQAFNLCNDLATDKDYAQFLGWARNAWAMMSMANYPYPATFLGNLPAYPVNVSCKAAVSLSNQLGAAPMAGLAFSTALLYNGTGDKQCHDIYKEYYYCADPTGCGLGNEAKAWDLQVCTELALGAGTNNVTDMFAPLPWTADMRTEYCHRVYGTVFKPDWLRYQFMTDDMAKGASRIIFSNGLLDPWHKGGVLENLSDSIIAIKISQAAHHLDLRGSNPADPQSVIDARKQIVQIIDEWSEKVRAQKLGLGWDDESHMVIREGRSDCWFNCSSMTVDM